MQVYTDLNGLQPNGAPYSVPPQKRVGPAPVRDGDQAQEDRRQNQSGTQSGQDGRPVFRTLFTEATQAGLTATANSAATTTQSTQDDKPVYERPEKRPESGPASLSDSDTNGLLAHIAAARQATESQAAAFVGPQDFVAAASKYAAQTVSSVDYFAGRGETLELQA